MSGPVRLLLRKTVTFCTSLYVWYMVHSKKATNNRSRTAPKVKPHLQKNISEDPPWSPSDKTIQYNTNKYRIASTHRSTPCAVRFHAQVSQEFRGNINTASTAREGTDYGRDAKRGPRKRPVRPSYLIPSTRPPRPSHPPPSSARCSPPVCSSSNAAPTRATLSPRESLVTGPQNSRGAQRPI